MAVKSPQDIYARHISSSRGYPMWTPEPSSQLLSYRPEGLRIGDVGVVVPESGSFDFFFNICLPKDHRVHQAIGVPDGFSPIELSDADIKTIPNAESAGQVLTASSVTRVGSDVASLLPRTGQDQSGATGYTFNLSSTEGALLVLPEGADRHDVRDPRPFFEQASRHAATWYRFAEENLGRIISHDAIYVITGFHKARSWGLAGYQTDRGDDSFSARFTVSAHEDGNLAASYRWETTRNMDWRTGPLKSLGIPNQSVFICGFKIALRSAVQGVPQRWISFEPNRPDVRRGTLSSDSWLANVWRGISKSLGPSSEKVDQTEKHENAGVRIEIQRIPEILPVFHPSDVINQYMLQKEPSARVAITHDSDWGSLLDENLLKPEELAQEELLMKVVSEKYNIVMREGVACLESKSGLAAPANAITDDCSATQTADQAPICETHEANEVKGNNEVARPSHPESLSVVSESNYRCLEESASESKAPESCPANLHSIPSKFEVTPGAGTPTSLRFIKIIVISDYLCSFCYICDKVLRDAIEACRDLPVRFDVEFRPFTLLNLSAVPPPNSKQEMYRNAYLTKRFGKEQAEIVLKAVGELAQKAGLKLAEDGIVCATTQAHRLSAKAYRDGGQSLQNKLNAYVFDACLAKGVNISDEDWLVNAAIDTGLMNKEEATAFLHSTECLDCVKKMAEAARAQGINGVPFVIIDGKWAVNGLQPVECFIQIFRKLAQLPAPSPVPGKPKKEQALGI